MKKLIFTTLMAACITMPMQAQELFKTVYEGALKVVNSADADDEQVEIRQFIVTDLNYITMQCQQRGLHKDDFLFYDSQAVNLKCFIDDFFFNITKARSISQAKRLEVLRIYQEASLKNPLFNDTNRTRTHCYVNDSKSLTPFSLDTDWDKAYEQATANVKAVFAK